jgi:hypothetical protein
MSQAFIAVDLLKWQFLTVKFEVAASGYVSVAQYIFMRLRISFVGPLKDLRVPPHQTHNSRQLIVQVRDVVVESPHWELQSLDC